ncbi:inducible metalloproteinase inhibitor protein-like [Amblyomma americanum]
MMATLILVIALPVVVQLSEASVCQANEVPGDPCRYPDNVCICNVTRQTPRPVETCSGCVCKDGYWRSLFGACEPVDSCLTCRGDLYADYKSCGSRCAPICNGTLSEVCPDICVGGCFCLPGYVRSSHNGTCVPIDVCPPLCRDPNQVYVSSVTCFPKTCDHGGHSRCGPPCGQPGCQCKQGFYTLPNGTCVDSC